MRLGLSLALPDESRFAASVAAFDPATLSLSGWWRAAYGGSPWSGVSSAGASSGRNLTEATNPPTVGTALNGLAGAAFNGTTSQLSLTIQQDVVYSATAYTVIGLMIANAAAADAGVNAPYNNPGVVATSAATGVGGSVHIGYSASGIRAGHWDGSSWASAAQAAATGSVFMFAVRYNGTLLGVGINGAVMTTTPKGNVAGLGDDTGLIRIGADDDASNFLNARIYELMLARVALSDADIASTKSYFNARYLLAL